MANETNTGKSGPTVAVVIPTYKRKSKLERAVNSVCNQSYTDWKLYVINDAPTYEVSDLLPDDDRITYIQHDKNRGASAARNTGIKASEAPYIAFLDDDDAWKPKKLERQIDILHNSSSNFGMVYTGMDIVKDEEEIEIRCPDIGGDIHTELLYKNFIPSPTPIVKRECFNNVGVFDTNLGSSQDIDMWLRIADKYQIGVVPEPLSIGYKQHESRISEDMTRKINGKRAFMNKHKTNLESHPTAMATHLKSLGIFFIYLGRSTAARKKFINSIRYNKMQPATLLYLFISLLPDLIKSPLFKYHRKRTS